MSSSISNSSSANDNPGTQESNQTDDSPLPADGQSIETTFRINVRLPHAPFKIQTIVSTQEQAQDIRQAIIEVPETIQYSCFHLEHNGNPIPDYVDLAEIHGIVPDCEVTLVEDPYTEKDARVHVLRIRDLVGMVSSRTDLVQGFHSGLSLYDHVTKSSTGGNATNGTSNTGKQTNTHAMADFDKDAPGSFSSLLQPMEEPSAKTLKSLSLSPWNPPPYNLRSRGHLLYLQATTNEGEHHQITAHVTGFYLNKSSNSKFDPFPRTAPKEAKAHSLLTLLSRISPSFDSSLKALQAYTAGRDPLSSFQATNTIPASPWIVATSAINLNSHQADITRTQESYLMAGADNAETLRDWNEEFQTTRELPRETVQDRVFRERVTSKLFADYNEAATRGAVLIARGEIPPLNPSEPFDAHIFVYNNVFYSFGADGVGTFVKEGGDEAARAATGKDVMGVKAVNQLDIDGLSTPGTVIVDYLGKRIVGQSIVPGIFKQREPGENQIDYGGIEGKEVVAENEAFPPLFKKLSSAMRVKPHAVWDKEGKRHDLKASVETKGLLGTDGRKYVLDLYRITPLDILFIEQNWEESEDREKYPHKMTVLRPELVESYWRLKLREYIREQLAKNNGETKTDDNEDNSNEEASGNVTAKDSEADVEAERKAVEQDRVDISGFSFTLNPDVFGGQEPQTDLEREQWSQDESDVRSVAQYLRSEIIPRLLLDLREGDVGFPMDGQSLSALLHKRGINIRYLGLIAQLADKPEPRLKALKDLAEQEMVSRAFKHVANGYLRSLPAPFAPACIAHMLNCFLGFKYNESPKAETDRSMRELYSQDHFQYEELTPDTFVDVIMRQVSLRYRYDLAPGWSSELKPVQTLRELSLKFGLQMVAREYEFEQNNSKVDAAYTNGQSSTTNGNISNPSNGKRKNKKTEPSPTRIAPSSSLPAQTFHADDILNIVPVLKEASPRSILAEEALEAGRISVARNEKELGQELLLESLSLHEQIYGILHAEVARIYSQLSSLFYGLDDKNIAVELARKAVIVSERTLGVDNSETVLAYLNLGLFEHAVSNTQAALTYVRHALELWKIVYGVKHPDSITTMNNAAVMLQQLKLYHDSRIWFEASLDVCLEVSGKKSVNTATLLFQLAQALALDQDSHGAVKRMKEAYSIFSEVLGPNDRNTKEAETWLEQLTQNAVSIARHAKDMQARKLRQLQTRASPNMSMGMRPQRQVGQTDSEATNATGLNRASGLDERSVEELLRYIEGNDTAKSSKTKKQHPNPRRRQRAAA